MMFRRTSISILLVVALLGCQENVIPKPKAKLRLEYPRATYEKLETKNFEFEKNKLAEPGNSKESNENDLILSYPSMKGSIFITYKKVGNNLENLIIDAQRLSFEHAAMADGITHTDFVNEEERIFGTYYVVRGDAASQAQFFVTDSTEHFLTGSLYFYVRPDYDSIYPAAAYLQNDIRKIMETIRWR